MVKTYSDFKGRTLSVSATNDWPFFRLKYLENGTVLPDSGIDISLLNCLSQALNFGFVWEMFELIKDIFINITMKWPSKSHNI